MDYTRPRHDSSAREGRDQGSSIYTPKLVRFVGPIYMLMCALFPVEVPMISIYSIAPNTVRSLHLKQFCQIVRLPSPILGNETIEWEEGHGRVQSEE